MSFNVDFSAAQAAHCEDEPLALASLAGQSIPLFADRSRNLRLKRFRTQLLHQWLIATFAPCRVADVGGGKGLLAYLLDGSGFHSTVIDPLDQPLPDKYKDVLTDQRVKIPPTARVERRTAAFQTEEAAGSEAAAGYDLLIGLHAHGSNARIIDAAARYGCGFVLMPCCVIDEPFFPRLGVLWIECLADYAARQGLPVFPFRLNFKGQNIGLCYAGRAPRNTTIPLISA